MGVYRTSDRPVEKYERVWDWSWGGGEVVCALCSALRPEQYFFQHTLLAPRGDLWERIGLVIGRWRSTNAYGTSHEAMEK